MVAVSLHVARREQCTGWGIILLPEDHEEDEVGLRSDKYCEHGHCGPKRNELQQPA